MVITKGMFFANTALTLNANVPEGYILSGWNVTVNGELLPIGVCDPAIAQYFRNVGWYQVLDPNLNY